MQIDKITFNDIAIFHQEEEFSIFHKLNFTKTVGGKAWLRHFFHEPHSDITKILGTQKIIKTLMEHVDDWPSDISNGTLMVMEKFLDYPIDPAPENPNTINSFTYKWLHLADYSMIKYSIKHFADFYRGISKLAAMFDEKSLPAHFYFYIERIKHLVKQTPLTRLSETKAGDIFTRQQNLYYAYHIRGEYRSGTLELIDIFCRLDAWYSMAVAVNTFNLSFP